MPISQLPQHDTKKHVWIDYSDKHGRRLQRRIEPVTGQLEFNYGAYPDPEWLITAIDVSGDGTLKTFSLAHIHSWKPIK